MRLVLNGLAVVAVVVLIVVVREETMTRHEPNHPRSEMEVVVDASSNSGDSDLAELVDALFRVCQLEVWTDPVGDPEPLDHDTFLLRMRPSLDISDRRQLGGCLEDARIDRLQAKVVSMERVADGGS